MKTTNEIKKFLKEVVGVTAKGNTSAGKARWQSFFVPCDRLPNPHVLQYSLPEFPVEFRKLCIRTVYPNSPTLHTQTSAGNIEKYRVAMHPAEWEHVMAIWPTLAQLPALKEATERELASLG